MVHSPTSSPPVPRTHHRPGSLHSKRGATFPCSLSPDNEPDQGNEESELELTHFSQRRCTCSPHYLSRHLVPGSSQSLVTPRLDPCPSDGCVIHRIWSASPSSRDHSRGDMGRDSPPPDLSLDQSLRDQRGRDRPQVLQSSASLSDSSQNGQFSLSRLPLQGYGPDSSSGSSSRENPPLGKIPKHCDTSGIHPRIRKRHRRSTVSSDD